MKRSIYIFVILVLTIGTVACQDDHSNGTGRNNVISSSDVASNKNGKGSIQNTPSPQSTPTIQTSQGSKSGSPNFQLTFGMEYEVKDKTPVPTEIWREMIAGEKNEATREQVLTQNDPNIWVDASKIDLNDDDNPDYVIVAKRGNWLGANVTTFWVFLAESEQYRSVLKLSALQLDFSDKRKNGFRVITGAGLTAKKFFETTYVYRDNQYEIQSSKNGDIK